MGAVLRRGKAMSSRRLNSLIGAAGDPAGGAVAIEGVGVHRTTLRLTSKAIALADAAGVVAYAGLKIYDFPEGNIVILDAIANLTVGKSSAGVIDAWDGDFSVGTVTASNNATLSSTEQDIIPTTATPQAVAGDTTAKGRLATSPVVLDGTGGAKDAYLNFLVDDTDHDVTTTPANLVVSGDITIVWCTAGDF